MKCNNYKEGQCLVVTSLSDLTRNTSPRTCEACCKTSAPMSENKVTCGLTILAIMEAGKSVKDYPRVQKLLLTQIEQGPGTELKKLISWFYSPDKKKCKCLTRIAKMNLWGPDKSLERMDTIVRWLKHSAKITSVPFFEPAVRLLIKQAIKNSRKEK